MGSLFILTLISSIFVAGASGLVGAFLVLRKMTLLSDALSHIALPGIALGVIFNFSPLLGGFLLLFFGVLLIWGIENKTKLAIESITGVLFVTALAAGSLLIPEQDLLEAFFGDVSNLNATNLIIQAVLALLIIVTILKFKKSLVLFSIAPDLAASHKVSGKKMELLLLTLIALTISIGIGFVGILLMSSIAIVPAVTARNIARTFNQFIGLSVGLAIFFLLSGLIIANTFAVAPGVATVMVSAFVFALSLCKK